MSLRSKVVLILVPAFVLLICFEYTVLNRHVLPEFFLLEQEEAREDLKRAESAINNEIHHLDIVCWDWASWDDAYDFIRTSSENFIKTNLGLRTFVDNSFDLMYFIDTEGRVVWGESYDHKTQEKLILRGFSEAVFLTLPPLVSDDIDERNPTEINVSGVFMTEKGPVMVACRPILTSNNKGPIRGFLIFGRIFNEEIARTLADQTRVDFDIIPIQAGPLDEALRDIPGRITAQDPYLIKKNGADHLLVYSIYPDIKGEPVLLLRARIPKKMSAKGSSTIYYAIVLMSASTVVLLLVVLLFLQQGVIKPMADLTNHALSIGGTGDLSARLALQRPDEIGVLAAEFDKMLMSLEERAKQLSVTNALLQKEIEDRKQAECALRESENLYRSFIQNFHGIAFKGQKPHMPEFLHGAVEEITGYTEEEFLSGKTTWERIIHPEDVLKIRKNVEKIIAIPNATSELEYRIIRKDGCLRWIHVYTQSYRGDPGQPNFVQGALYDVTEQKNLESRLLHAQKMEAIGTLAAGVAHEFNNFLMTIVMNTDFALRKLMGNPPVQESLGTALEAAYRARDLVDQILTFSRKSAEELFPLTISPILKELLRIFRASLPDTIEIRSNIESDTAKVCASPSLLNQIFVNLFSNAAYAMKDGGGTITVGLVEEILDSEAQLIHPDISPGLYLRLSVSDTGKGMPPEVVEKIFEPFFTTKSTGEGHGMGLSVVHGIVEILGGVITVKSEPGKGTVFDLLLPMIEDREPAPTEYFPALQQGHGKILVVDDEVILIRIFERVLNHCGYQILGKTNSLEALETFKQAPGQFHLVITDQAMPQMSGMDLAKQILSIRPDIPIILCTGFSDHVIEKRSVEAGIRMILKKPINISTITEAVYNLLNIKPKS